MKRDICLTPVVLCNSAFVPIRPIAGGLGCFGLPDPPGR
jgi:hypothetical protein